MQVEKLTADDFEQLLFEKFHVKRPEGELDDASCSMEGSYQHPEIELIEVNRLHRIRKREGGLGERKREPFSLLFRGSHEHVFVSHIHQLIHEKLGVIDLFLNPVNVDPVHATDEHPEGRYYEVHFN